MGSNPIRLIQRGCLDTETEVHKGKSIEDMGRTLSLTQRMPEATRSQKKHTEQILPYNPKKKINSDNTLI